MKGYSNGITEKSLCIPHYLRYAVASSEHRFSTGHILDIQKRKEHRNHKDCNRNIYIPYTMVHALYCLFIHKKSHEEKWHERKGSLIAECICREIIIKHINAVNDVIRIPSGNEAYQT